MRSAISAFMVAAMVVSAQGQERKEPGQMTTARLRYERAVETAKRAYVLELSSVQRQLTQQGDLDGALCVKAEVDRLEGKAEPPKTPPAEKEGEYAVFKGHRYEVISDAATRKKAETECRNRGGALACADTTEELNFLHGLMRRKMVSPFWVDSKVGIEGAQWMRVNGALDISLPKRAAENLPYICEWNQDADGGQNNPPGRAR